MFVFLRHAKKQSNLKKMEKPRRKYMGAIVWVPKKKKKTHEKKQERKILKKRSI